MMESIQQRCRPKHQVLVLKCYPRTTKGAVDVKPNSSELSYLLFYALSRRSKIQKIGSFLEKKTASDVYRLRIGNVQVTLQILTALMEKSAKDVALIAPCVLKILDLVLRSGDLTMVESSITTFDAFCQHIDASSLLADQANLRQYELVVRSYAGLASADGPPYKGIFTRPVAMRWRIAGLQAVRCIASSDALSTMSGRQIDVIVPMVLENLWSETGDALDPLVQRVQMEEKAESDKTLLRRRTSIVTLRTTEATGDTNPLALAGTAQDVDTLAAQDMAVLAMQCLKQIFVVPSRPQLYAATAALLRFISDRAAEITPDSVDGLDHCAGWAVRVFIFVSRWAPVQDRYVILVTAMDTIAKIQVSHDPTSPSVLLTVMIGSLLRSDVNLIGLSVMDVLLGLVQQLRRRAQATKPPAPPASNSTLFAGAGKGAANLDRDSALQRDVLRGVQTCIGDLATHVYYADQITDMISALLAKLRPSRASSSSSSPHGEKADADTSPSDVTFAEPVLSPGYPDGYIMQDMGKVAVLGAIKSILLVANLRMKMSGNADFSRNRVPIQVWEGTDWLLREPDGAVRKAYADALVTWLDRETTPVDAKARTEGPPPHRASLKKIFSTRDLSPLPPSRRAMSSASYRERLTVKAARSYFLSRLHVAAYDNALQYIESESDFGLLHVLLARLVGRLGVNAARYGLPMVFRLQEDIQVAEAPIHKVRIGSLCHGYFWALTHTFDCEDSAVGRTVIAEIVRRRSKNFWVESVTVPVPAFEASSIPGAAARPQPRIPIHELESESLLPFDDRDGLVQCINIGYAKSIASPPASPNASPGRTMSVPMFSPFMSGVSIFGAVGADRLEGSLPGYLREQMLADWSRDTALLTLHDESKSTSLYGSRTGTPGTHPPNQRRVFSHGGLFHTNENFQLSSSPHGSQTNLRPLAVKMRKGSVRSGISAPPSESSCGAVTTVEALKMVLSGLATASPQQPSVAASTRSAAIPALDGSASGIKAEDSGSDSMASYDAPPSEQSLATTSRRPLTPIRPASQDRKVELGPLTSNPPLDPFPGSATGQSDVNSMISTPERNIPPVPPLPATMHLLGVLPNKSSGDLVALAKAHQEQQRHDGTSARRLASDGVADNRLFGPPRTGPGIGPAADLRDLLLGISSKPAEDRFATLAAPPY